MRNKYISENDIKTDCKEWLDFNGWFHFPIIQNFKIAKGMSGLPDRIAIKNGIVLFIEIKKPGGKWSAKQQEFAESVRQHGGHYIVVESWLELSEYAGVCKS
jgi:hypothetical protein